VDRLATEPSTGEVFFAGFFPRTIWIAFGHKLFILCLKQKEVITTEQTCMMCTSESATHSLPLSRGKESRDWTTNPIGARCRLALIREAKALGQFVKIYGLEASTREAFRRNAESRALRTVLAKFGDVARVKPASQKQAERKRANG
jgi:hypothetical protein